MFGARAIAHAHTYPHCRERIAPDITVAGPTRRRDLTLTEGASRQTSRLPVAHMVMHDLQSLILFIACTSRELAISSYRMCWL